MARHWKLLVTSAVIALLTTAVVWRRTREEAADRHAGASSTIRRTWWMWSANPIRSIGIAGTVRDANGNPVVGAHVTAVESSDSDHEVVAAREIEPAASAVTAAAGRFHLDLPAGRWNVTATAAASLPGMQRDVEVVDESVANVDLVLGVEGSRVYGVVKDLDGVDVEDARIIAVGHGRQRDVFAATSGPDGRYDLVLPPDEYGVRVEARGYASSWNGAFLGPDVQLDFILARAARIDGHVLDLEGAAVEGADVTARVDCEYISCPVRRATTNDRGRFVIDGLEFGDWQLIARRGVLAGRLTSKVSVTTGSHVEDVQLVIGAQRSLAGEVTTSDGPVVARIAVAQGHQNANFSIEETAIKATTGNDGRYRVDGLFPGRYELRVAAGGFTTTSIRMTIGNEDVVQDVNLAKSAVLSGSVIDGTGRPASGASVFVRSGSRSDAMTETDDEGRWEISGLAAGKVGIQATSASIGRSAPLELTMKEGEQSTVELRLLPASKISGSVRFENGQAVGGAVVMATEHLTFARAITNSDGLYTVGPVGSGPVDVWAHTSHGVSSGLKEVTIVDGEDLHLDIVVKQANRPIDGIVKSEDGDVIPAAKVTADCFQQYSFPAKGTAYSGSDGTFRLGNLPAGDCSIRAMHPDYTPSDEVAVESGATAVVITLTEGSSLGGRVSDVPGAAISHCVIRATSQTHRRNEHATETHDPNGSFLIERVVPDDYDLYASCPPNRVGKLLGVQLEAGESRSDLVIPVGAGITLVGRLVEFRTEKPIADASIRVWDDAGMQPRVRTDASGRFSIPSVTPGSRCSLHAGFGGSGDQWNLTASRPDGTILDLGTLRLLPGRSPLQSKTGIAVDVLDGIIRIASVAPGSAAADAGLQTALLLERVDGQAVAGLGAFGVSALLDASPGPEIVLELVSAEGAPKSVTIRN